MTKKSLESYYLKPANAVVTEAFGVTRQKRRSILEYIMALQKDRDTLVKFYTALVTEHENILEEVEVLEDRIRELEARLESIMRAARGDEADYELLMMR